MTRLGFFSAVAARQGDGARTQPVDPDRLMVRVRDPQHLDNLQSQFPELRDCQRINTPPADYPARLFVAKDVWARVVAALVRDTDYDNFKAAVQAARITSHTYYGALTRVWSVMRGCTPGPAQP